MYAIRREGKQDERFFLYTRSGRGSHVKNHRDRGAPGALSAACKYTLCFTGTFAGGYSSDLYHLLFRPHPHLMLEDKNEWGNPKRFFEWYGILEKITTVKEKDGLTTKAKRL